MLIAERSDLPYSLISMKMLLTWDTIVFKPEVMYERGTNALER
jgi:hypothetical protein